MALIYTTTEIQTVIDNAKCCLGDLTCKMLKKAIGGDEFSGSMYFAIELSMIIFSLEMFLLLQDENCMTDDQVIKMIHRTNKLCNCNCTSSATSAAIGQHTVAEHTTLSHTI